MNGVGLVSNQHVLEGVEQSNIHNVDIHNWNDSAHPFKLISFVKSDEVTDLAVIDPGVHKASLKPLELNNNPNYDIGRTVYILGYPNHADDEPPTILIVTSQAISTTLYRPI